MAAQIPGDEKHSFLNLKILHGHFSLTVFVHVRQKELSERGTTRSLTSCFWFNLEVVKINPGNIFAIYSKEIHSEGLWYRVKVLKVKGDNVQIEYMDYGDTAMVPSSSLKNIPPRFLELPFQVCE